MTLRLARISIVMALFATLFAPESFAKPAFGDSDGETFSNSAKVSDKELSKQRGGYVDINGLLIDFSFMSQGSINGNIVTQMGFNLTDLMSGAQSGNYTQVIQNGVDGAVISLINTMNLNIANGAQWANTQAYNSAINYQAAMSVR